MKFIIDSLSQQEEIKYRTDGNEHHQRQHKILLDAPGLDSPQFSAKPICDICGTVTEEAIDDGQVKVIADEGTKPICGRTEDVQNAVDHALVHEFVNNVFREPVGRFDEHAIINLVKIIFVLEKRDLE